MVVEQAKYSTRRNDGSLNDQCESGVVDVLLVAVSHIAFNSNQLKPILD